MLTILQDLDVQRGPETGMKQSILQEGEGLAGSLSMLHHSNSHSAFSSFTAVVPRPCARGEAKVMSHVVLGSSACDPFMQQREEVHSMLAVR